MTHEAADARCHSGTKNGYDSSPNPVTGRLVLLDIQPYFFLNAYSMATKLQRFGSIVIRPNQKHSTRYFLHRFLIDHPAAIFAKTNFYGTYITG